MCEMAKVEDWTEKELREEVSKYKAVTVPVDVRLEAQQHVLDLSQMTRLLKDAKLIAVGECYCRKKYEKCEGPLDVCISLDAEAEELLAKELGRKVGLDEALEVLEKTHKAGLVHIAYTFRGKEKPEVICSCCSCCCHSMSALIRFGMPDAVVESKYVATNNWDTCVNCGTCVRRCQFEARHLKNEEMRFTASRCFGCGLCVTTCPTKSISLKKRTGTAE